MRYDYNSTTNQDIKGKFVGREVYCCVSSMMFDLLGGDKGFNESLYEDIENLYVYNVDGEEYNNEERETKIQELKDEQTDLYNDNGEITDTVRFREIEDEIEQFENAESEPQEIYEWWAVSRWLFEKLKAKGEPVLDYGGTYLWGRTCSGRDILLDHVISEICYDLEILEGQANDWSK